MGARNIVVGAFLFTVGSAICVFAFDLIANPATLDRQLLLERPLVLAGAWW